MTAGTRRPRTRVADLDAVADPDQPVRVCGFAEEVQLSKDPPVVVLRDGGATVRLVCEPRRVTVDLRAGSAIEAIGPVHLGDGGPYMHVDELNVPGPACRNLPLDASAPLAQRLDWRYLDLRSPRNRLIFEVQTTAERAMRDFWYERGYIEMHSPKLRHVPNKAGDLFPVAYFDGSAYLVQSPQFYKQMAMAAGFDRVFEIGPAFRAEAAVSGRHATEFTSVDVEIAWIDSDEDLMALEEQLLCEVLAAVRDAHGEQIARWFGAEVRVPSRPFPRVRLEDARRIVGAGEPTGDTEDDDLDPGDEHELARHMTREHGHEFVFVTHYPELTRPFFHMRWDGQWPATRSFDLLWKGLEITSGAQREHRHDRLVAQAWSREVPLELVEHFLGFFACGCPPHGGFGLGLGRFLLSLLGLDDLREVTFLFRGRDRLTP